jgi:hypothetical protein
MIDKCHLCAKEFYDNIGAATKMETTIMMIQLSLMVLSLAITMGMTKPVPEVEDAGEHLIVAV